MTKKNKNFSLAVIVVVILLSAMVFRFYNNWQTLKKIESNKTGDTAYARLITRKDTEALPKAPAGRSIKLPILMYHHVGPLPEKPTGLRRDLTVSAEEFTAQVKWLKDNGYTSIHLSDLRDFAAGKFTMPKNPVIFTFDDGYEDVFLYAAPILKQNGFSGSFAIITQFPGTQNGDNFYASWNEIAKAYDAGNEIVSHTQDHFDGKNPKFSNDFIYKNLCDSKNDISSHLGFNTDILIYPYGHYTANYIQQAKACGFDLGITVHEGNRVNLENLMEIPRIRVHGRQDFEKFKQLVAE